MLFFVFLYGLLKKSTIDISIATLLSSHFVYMKYLYPSLQFVCISFALKIVSCRQHAYGSCFLNPVSRLMSSDFFFFQQFSFVLSIEISFSAFSLCFTNSASINLGEIFTNCSLKVLSICRVSLCRLRVPSAFCGRSGFVDTNHIFAQCVLAAFSLIGGGAEDGGAGARAWNELGLPLCSVAVTALSGAGSDPKLWSRSPDGQSWAGSFPLSICLPCF